jgi:hypothetical protein
MMKKYTNKQLSQLEALNKQIEIRSARHHNIELRNQWMRAKTIKNYQSEYDRIRSHLNDSTLPGATREMIVKRKTTLEGLGARAFDTISDNMAEERTPGLRRLRRID